MDHIEALQEIIKYQKEKIERLETELAKEKTKSHLDFSKYFQQQNSIPAIGGHISISNCAHEFPQIWNGIGHPPCKKCNYTPNGYTFTCQQQQYMGQQGNMGILPENQRNSG